MSSDRGAVCRQNLFVIFGVTIGTFFLAVIVANTALLFSQMGAGRMRDLRRRTLLRDTTEVVRRACKFDPRVNRAWPYYIWGAATHVLRCTVPELTKQFI